MSIFNNFLAVLLASTTGFTGTLQDVPLKPATEQVQTVVQSSIDEANSIAQSSGMNAGIVVIDRAKKNMMKTNGEPSHKQFPLESLGRLHILLYAIINDPAVVKGDVPQIVSMMQGYSGASTRDMWEKYGRSQIISDLAVRYNLQETTAKDSWGTSTSSAVDVARLIRRFLDDKGVSVEEKKFAIELLRSTSLEVSGQKYSFGLPDVRIGENDASQQGDTEKQYLAFAQGSSASGSNPMMRSSVGVVDQAMRYIVVILSEVSPNTSDADADTIASQVATAVASDAALELKNTNIDSEEDPDVKAFLGKQADIFGSFAVSRR